MLSKHFIFIVVQTTSCIVNGSARKHYGKKEKMLVNSIFSFFKKCFQQAFFFPGSLKVGIASKRVHPFPNKPWFLRVCSTSLLKTLWEKEKLLETSNFSFSHSVFYPYREFFFFFFFIFIKFEIVTCKICQSANPLNLEESKICRLGKGLTIFNTVIHNWITFSANGLQHIFI